MQGYICVSISPIYQNLVGLRDQHCTGEVVAANIGLQISIYLAVQARILSATQGRSDYQHSRDFDAGSHTRHCFKFIPREAATDLPYSSGRTLGRVLRSGGSVSR